MAVSEYQRQQVMNWFEEHMGPEIAPTMMEFIPPAGWGEVATHADLDRLRSELQSDMARMQRNLMSFMFLGYTGIIAVLSVIVAVLR